MPRWFVQKEHDRLDRALCYFQVCVCCDIGLKLCFSAEDLLQRRNFVACQLVVELAVLSPVWGSTQGSGFTL